MKPLDKSGKTPTTKKDLTPSASKKSPKKKRNKTKSPKNKQNDDVDNLLGQDTSVNSIMSKLKKNNVKLKKKSLVRSTTLFDALQDQGDNGDSVLLSKDNEELKSIMK